MQAICYNFIMSNGEDKNCPISFSLESFGDRWSLLILRDILLEDKKHYNEFLESGESISTNILADRLKKLQTEGILSKNRDPENKKQFIYSPTIKCLDLLPIMLEMAEWGAKYDPDTAAPSSEIAKIRKNRKEYIENIRKKFRYTNK